MNVQLNLNKRIFTPKAYPYILITLTDGNFGMAARLPLRVIALLKS